MTLTYEALADEERRGRRARDADRFVRAMNQIFREENLHYEVDPRGGVHLSVDQEFDRNRTSVLRGLGSDRYVNVASNFEDAHKRLTAIPTDGKGAVRAMFDGAEGLFKLMFKKEPRLTAQRARTLLLPLLQKMTDGNPPAAAASSKALDALCEWVDACHNYRREHGQPEALQPLTGWQSCW